MQIGIAWGKETLQLEIDEHNLVTAHRALIAANVADPSQAMRDALEKPLDYPPLRLALTPDDHVAVVIDEGTPQLAKLLIPLLEHIAQAHVQPARITLVCPPPTQGQAWLDDLPEQFEDVQVEVHQPGDRKKVAYLATSKRGQRVYLNRTAVDADQVVVLGRRRYDPVLGCSGAETALYPSLGDEATLQELRGELDVEAPIEEISEIQAVAREIAWLSGAPFFVQVIEGAADGIAHVLAGPLESSDAGRRLLDARWLAEYDRAVDVVIASVTGDPARRTQEDLARAFFSASRIVKPNGVIVLLSDIVPALGAGLESFRAHDDPALALSILLREQPDDLSAAYMWATAANQARLYLLSGLPGDVAEELFTTPLQHAGQAQRLLTAQATCALLPDADRMLALVCGD